MVLVENELEYEINQNGERILVRSIEAIKRVPVRFKNATTHHIEVHWRDYSGRKRRYGTLSPGAYLDVDTYATHPWIFEDRFTKERFLIYKKTVFYPPPSQPSQYRTNWDIIIPVRTLRQTALLNLASLISDPAICNRLHLPASLANELRNLVTRRRAAEDSSMDG